jgi:hypothetical protein
LNLGRILGYFGLTEEINGYEFESVVLISSIMFAIAFQEYRYYCAEDEVIENIEEIKKHQKTRRN